jgi:hypothetical protein
VHGVANPIRAGKKQTPISCAVPAIERILRKSLQTPNLLRYADPNRERKVVRDSISATTRIVSMEAVAMETLIEKGGTTPQLAQAIGEALDITLKAANLVTVPMLDARFAQQEAKLEVRFGAMEARFSALERAFESTKVWAVLLYAGLTIVFFGALAVDHRWLLNRQDQFTAQIDARFAAEGARTDRLIAQDRAQTDRLIAQDQARTDQLIAEQRAHADQVQARTDAKFDQLRSLLINRLRKP